MGDPKIDLLQGTLDLLILETPTSAPCHGWGIAKRIQERSREILQVGQGSLYPALYRLEDRGWIAAEWGLSPEGRRVKFYRFTRAAKKQLVAEAELWRRFSLGVNHVLQGGSVAQSAAFAKLLTGCPTRCALGREPARIHPSPLRRANR